MQTITKQEERTFQLSFPFRVTVLTLVAYFIGLFAVLSITTSFILIFILSLSTRLVQNNFYQSSLTLLSFISTTFIFGLVHAYTLNLLNSFLYQDPSLPQIWPLLQIYLSFMCIYYYFQFQLNNNFHHPQLSWNSFLINHSKHYIFAHVFSLTQHILAKYVFSFEYKNSHLLIYPSLILMILGEGLRICAFFTAKSNFTHLVRYKRHPNHQLITHGVYSFFRHPSYTGYFYFTIASQLFIGNWISAITFFIVLIKFFQNRIDEEQLMLADFFEKYLYYKKKSYILIPFIKDPSSEQIMKALIKKSRFR